MQLIRLPKHTFAENAVITDFPGDCRDQALTWTPEMQHAEFNNDRP